MARDLSMDLKNAEKILQKYSLFEECILLNYWSLNLNRDFLILISNIRDSSGELRVDLDSINPVVIRYLCCQRIEINNCFPSILIDCWDRADWGINEFACINVEKLNQDLLRFHILWESDRYIRVDCKGIEIEENTSAHLGKYNFPYLDKDT